MESLGGRVRRLDSTPVSRTTIPVGRATQDSRSLLQIQCTSPSGSISIPPVHDTGEAPSKVNSQYTRTNDETPHGLWNRVHRTGGVRLESRIPSRYFPTSAVASTS